MLVGWFLMPTDELSPGTTGLKGHSVTRDKNVRKGTSAPVYPRAFNLFGYSRTVQKEHSQPICWQPECRETKFWPCGAGGSMGGGPTFMRNREPGSPVFPPELVLPQGPLADAVPTGRLNPTPANLGAEEKPAWGESRCAGFPEWGLCCSRCGRSDHTEKLGGLRAHCAQWSMPHSTENPSPALEVL